MHDLKDYVEYDGEIRDGEHPVLVWHPKHGYYFTQFGFVISPMKIVAKKLLTA